MNQSTDKTAPLADANTQAQVNFDQELAIALGLASDIELDFRNDKETPVLSLVSNTVKEFQADMVELSHKFRSAAAKMTALIFMPANLMTNKSDADHKLQFSAILIEQKDPSVSFAPSPPVSMIKSSEVETQREEEEEEQTTKRLEMGLQQQLLWFQEFGKDGFINTPAATTQELDQATSQTEPATGQATEKTKRHLTLLTEHVQAA